jgi:5-methylcytosine-specific restriction endonuclease McrA
MSSGARRVENERMDWRRAHEALSRLAKERAAADAVEGRWLLAALRSAAHVHLGFGSFGEYVERLFGYRPRSTQEKLRVAEALEELPRIAEALENGGLNWSCARELTRVAVAENEREWLDAAGGKTVHQLEALVSGKAPGDRPSSPSHTSAQRHVLRFEVAPETLALFREAMNKLRRGNAGPLDDDSALLSMARHVLGGPRDAGRASYQIALSVCPECGKGGQQASGELVTVSAEVVAMANCDGQHLGLVDAPANELAAANQGADVGASITAKTSGRAGRCNQRRARSPSAHTGALTEADASHRRPNTHAPPRAKQTIPPATRRAVLLRDHHRCSVPGCRNVVFLNLHHIELRSEGGGNETDNLVTLCGAHHRAAHRGQLAISGSASTGVRFRHADGSDYGQVAQPLFAETQAKAFAALRGLGFREHEVRRVLGEVSQTSSDREPDLESLLRRALSRLTSPGASACVSVDDEASHRDSSRRVAMSSYQQTARRSGSN